MKAGNRKSTTPLRARLSSDLNSGSGCDYSLPLNDSKPSTTSGLSSHAHASNNVPKPRRSNYSGTNTPLNGSQHGQLFQWNSPSSGGGPYLFISHDNPQMVNSVNSSPKAMEIMLESKDDKDVTYFVFGTIVYSGSIEGVENSELFNPRGSNFFICAQMKGVKGKAKLFLTRPKPGSSDINEIDIYSGGSSSSSSSSTDPNFATMELDTVDKVKQFLLPCVNRVEVILHPYHTNHQWYPYWEGMNACVCICVSFQMSGSSSVSVLLWSINTMNSCVTLIIHRYQLFSIFDFIY